MSVASADGFLAILLNVAMHVTGRDDNTTTKLLIAYLIGA